MFQETPEDREPYDLRAQVVDLKDLLAGDKIATLHHIYVLLSKVFAFKDIEEAQITKISERMLMIEQKFETLQNSVTQAIEESFQKLYQIIKGDMQSTTLEIFRGESSDVMVAMENLKTELLAKLEPVSTSERVLIDDEFDSDGDY